ncbi:MAG: nuclear transport factor 2 family protein [Winogradskyella sp.]|nr:MAG: nuclear transport factor 2 family protein [Winogradskyella sp.]
MSNKESAMAFLNLSALGKSKEAFDTFTSDDFIHHNQYFKGSREALLKAIEEDHKTNPNKSIEVIKCYEEKDTVITHSHVIKHDMEIAVVHIFRFEKEKVVELWDLGQIIEKDCLNENGLF